MKTPSVSVVVPAYNAERHVAETLSAVLSQSHSPDEVIVVDDGSTDGTADELARFRGEVRVLSQANRGAAGAHNTGFTAARGTYVARCDADDVWGPDKLERQLDVVRRHPEVDIALGAAWVFGREERLFAEPPGEGILDERAFRRTLYRANVVCASSALIRRDLFEKLAARISAGCSSTPTATPRPGRRSRSRCVTGPAPSPWPGHCWCPCPRATGGR